MFKILKTKTEKCLIWVGQKGIHIEWKFLVLWKSIWVFTWQIYNQMFNVEYGFDKSTWISLTYQYYKIDKLFSLSFLYSSKIRLKLTTTKNAAHALRKVTHFYCNCLKNFLPFSPTLAKQLSQLNFGPRASRLPSFFWPFTDVFLSDLLKGGGRLYTD